MIKFQSDDRSDAYGWSGGVAAKDRSRYGMVADPSGVYDRVWHVQVRPGDNNVQGSNQGERCEGNHYGDALADATTGKEGVTLFTAFDVIFGNGYAPSTSEWNEFSQWHNSDTTGGTSGFHTPGESIDLSVAANDNNIWQTERFTLVPKRQNMRRYEFVIQWDWSEDPTKGGVACWVDGDAVLPYRHMKTLFKRQTTYPKLGNYREPQSFVADLYFHGYRVSTTLEEAVAAFTKSSHLDKWNVVLGGTPTPPPPTIDHVAAAIHELQTTTIKYADWKERVDTNFYVDRHIDPNTGTSWGRAFAYLNQIGK